MLFPRLALVKSCTGILPAIAVCGCAGGLSVQRTPPAASPAAEAVSSSVPPNYTLAFSDDFSGTTLDTSKWSYRTGARSLSEQLSANVVVSSNVLNINVEQQADDIASWTGGGIISRGSFRYGYYQVDAQVTANPGWHTSFWAANAAEAAQTTEIDGFEIDTQTPTQESMGLHSWVNGTDTDPLRCSAVPPSAGYNGAAAMHTYGFEWTEDGINYYMDGSAVCTQQYPAATYTHSLVNIQLSSIGYTVGDISVANNPSSNRFANVSYFVRDYYVNALEPGYTTTGSWFTSSLTGFANLPTQASKDANCSAVYAPNILVAGKYDVQVWKVQNGSNDPAVPITVNASEGAILNRHDFTKGVSEWIDLGIYQFEVGSNGSVVIGYSGIGYARSSMVKFVRQ